MKYSLGGIEQVALTVMNLAGAMFFKSCSLKDAFYASEAALDGLVYCTIALAFAPVKLIYQLFKTVINPEEAITINYWPNFGNPKIKLIIYS